MSEIQDIRIYMAPLRGVTIAPYRNVFARYFDGVDVAMAPFISADGISRMKRPHLGEVLPENNSGLPVIPQLIGKTAEGILAACKALRELGYTEANWNLGCPWPFVIKKQRGSGLLPHPDRIRAVLDGIAAASVCRISVKARLGTDRPDQLIKLVPLLNEYPLSEVVIHPRTALQMYGGAVDLDAFEECLGALKHRVIYNGDIRAAEDFRRLRRRFPSVQGWMLGRGLVADPFLAEEIRGMPVRKNTDAIRRFHDELYDTYKERLRGPRPVLGKMKELWFYLSSSVTEGSEMLKSIQRSKTLSAYEAVVGEIFSRPSI